MKFRIQFVTDIGKMLIKIISRNITSNARMFIFITYNFFYLWPHTLRIISAKDVHITKISIVFVPWWHSLRYFSVPCNSAIILGRCCCIALACTLSRWYISLIISWVIHGLYRFLSRKLFVRAYLSHISVYDNLHWSYDISSSSWEPLRMSHGIKSCSKIFASKFFISRNLTVSWSTVGDFVSLNSIWVWMGKIVTHCIFENCTLAMEFWVRR